jgi:hypothetical protein
VERNRRDEYIGTLVNAWLARGGNALGIRAGESYVDVGTLNGYREAMNLLCRDQCIASVPDANSFAVTNRVEPHVVA